MGIHYIKCPRCEFNWIPDTEQYCDICKKELHMTTNVSLIGDEVDEDESLVLCPYCKVNYIEDGEEMCMQCRSDRRDKIEAEGENEKWDSSSISEDEAATEGEDIGDWEDGALDVAPEDEEMIVEDFEEEEEEEDGEVEEEKEADGYNDADFDEMFLDEDFDEDEDEDEEAEEDEEDDK